jgi:peptide/nickel transport system substrate-binding protein
MAKKLILTIVALIGIMAMVLPGCSNGGGEAIPYKNDGDFVQETIGEISSLDPAWAYDTAGGEQIQYIYETLVFYNGTSTDTFVPILATSWTVVNSTQMRFCIRPDVHFSNGDLLTAEDAAYSLQRLMVQDRAGGPAWMLNLPIFGLARTRQAGNITDAFEAIQNGVQVDGDCVVINQNPDSAVGTNVLLQILCSSWASILDKQWCIDNGEWDPSLPIEDWADYNNPAKQDSYLYNQAMGTGPWKLDVWASGDYIRLLKNDSWWQGTPPFNMVLTKHVTEWTSRKLSLLQGDADLVYVPRNYIAELEDIADLNAIKDLPELAVETLFFNFDIASDSSYIGSGALDGDGIPTDFFTDEDVRKGFAYAFDYETYINDALQGEAEQRGSPVIEGLLGYNPDESMYEFDMTKAQEHLEDAWGGEVWSKGFHFTICYNLGNDPRRIAAEIMANNLLALNDKFIVDVLGIQWDVFLDKMCTQPCPMPIWVVGWQVDYPDPDDYVSPYMASYGDFAYFQGYGNPTLDAQIEAARYETDTATRISMYHDLEEVYYEDVPGIMTAQTLGRRFFTKYVQDFYFNPVIPGLPGPLWKMSKSES